MLSYASPTPVDRNGNVLPLSAATGPAFAATSSGLNVSSLVTLDGRATTVQITTFNAPAVGKWFGSGVASPSVTAQNFDFSVPANWTNYQVIPVSVQGVATAGSIVGGFGTMNGLYPTLAMLSIGNIATPSILVAQY